jgi:hypothetical protein
MESGGKVARGGAGKATFLMSPSERAYYRCRTNETPWTCRKEDGEAGSVWKEVAEEAPGWMDGRMDGDNVLMVGSSILAWRLAIEGNS